jgi:hypothetical protein
MFQFSVDAAQQNRVHGQPAALASTSLPTLPVFMFTRTIITRGVILPTLK